MKGFISGLLLAAITIIFFLALDPVIAVLISTILLFCYSSFILREKITNQYMLAFLLALVWTRYANHFYMYNRIKWNFFGIPFFPLITWAFGLTVLTIFHKGAMELFKINKKYNFLIWYAIYGPSLVFVEMLGYHLFNIKLISHYSGLPIFDCLHVPLWMKIAYFSMAALYFLLLHFYSFFLEGLLSRAFRSPSRFIAIQFPSSSLPCFASINREDSGKSIR